MNNKGSMQSNQQISQDTKENGGKPSAEVRALNFELNNVGEIVAPSKEQIVWHFTINGVIHKVELYNSILTKRKRVVVDQQEKYDTGRVGLFDNVDFSYDFFIDGVPIDIEEDNDIFVMKIMGIPFHRLYLEERKKKREQKIKRTEDNRDAAKDFFEEITAKIDSGEAVEEKVVWLNVMDENEVPFNEQDLNQIATPFD